MRRGEHSLVPFCAFLAFGGSLSYRERDLSALSKKIIHQKLRVWLRLMNFLSGLFDLVRGGSTPLSLPYLPRQ